MLLLILSRGFSRASLSTDRTAIPRVMSARILIIEDEVALVEMIRYALSADRFETVGCVTGAAGLKEMERGGVDLVILDIGLPDCHGFELFHRIRAIAPVPVIFLTARGTEVDRVVGLELGADDYITKPFSPRELTARVRSVLRRVTRTPPSSSADPAPPQAGALPFKLDEEKRSVQYYGRRLGLTRYEYGVLRLLVRRPGRVYTREELLEQVWEESEECSDRTVDTHIKTLRAKLRAIKPEKEPIRTHRGLGYALSEDW